LNTLLAILLVHLLCRWLVHVLVRVDALSYQLPARLAT
jgi:hypothetical protein